MTLIKQIKSNYKRINGIYYLTEPGKSFEDIYIKVRKAEGRLYNDGELKQLPDIDSSHKQYSEWRARKHSMQMLLDYLAPKAKNKTILEPGCGNGWLSNKLARLEFSEVIGLDVNITELEQAARVFSGNDNLIFVYGDIFGLPPLRGDTEGGFRFDYIILSSVIAYFKDLKALIDSLINNLNAGGEIHIIDSPFYDDILSARERSKKYYNELGYPGMSEHYYHHSLEDLKKYNYSVSYNHDTTTNKIKRKLGSALSPFYWIKITK